MALFPSLKLTVQIVAGLLESFTRSAVTDKTLTELASSLADAPPPDEIGRLCEALLAANGKKHLSDLAFASLQLLYHVGVIGMKMSPESRTQWPYRSADALTQGDMKRANLFKVHKTIE
jgi:hypothetical protein